MMALSARVGFAQETTSKDEEIQDLKRRLEILEKDKQSKEAVTPGAALVTDPVEEKWYDKVHVGGGIRTEYRAAEVPIAGGTSKYTSDFAMDNARLYTGAKINDFLSVTLNAEFMATPAVLDAIAQMKISDALNIYTGRLLPATDRSNSDGPYYLSTWDFPFLSDSFNFAGKTGDRDDGVTVWGDVGNFKYWVGVYEGHDNGAPNARFGDRLLYAARVQYNFLDAEPGYYLQSTYYGDKKILAVGLVANYQSNAAGTVAAPVDAGNVALDFLFEDKLGDLVLTTEAAFYYFGRHGSGATPGTFDTGAGTGFLASVAILLPGKIGWGQFQPHIRYQGFNEGETSANNPVANNQARWDLGVNYVMAGHNARISLVYSVTSITGPQEFGQIVIGTQFQF
jgi:hypothetical protein